MSLKDTYTKFLASPRAATLSSNPSLHYITSTQSIVSAESIVKHLNREASQLKKRVEKVLSCVEAQDALVLEIETEIEFVYSGGSFLPAMDDNFVTDQVVTLPIVHFVKFQDGLIKQIRLLWDQSTVLKQLGIIGRNGRNWPIKDGREQCKLIANSVDDSLNGTSNGFESTRPVSSRTRKVSNPTNDPHSTLSIFDPPEEKREPVQTSVVVPPRKTAKPPPRDLDEILGANGDGTPANNEKSPVVSPKGRAVNVRERSFELGSGDEVYANSSTSNPTKVDPSKYSHFEFTEPEVTLPSHTASTTLSAKNSKSTSSWGFEDFVTPEKKPTKLRKDDIRHFSWEEEEGESEDEHPKFKKKAGPRRDAETHFAIKDEDTPQTSKLSNISNRQSRRDNEAHFEIVDESPVANRKVQKELPPARKTAVKSSHRGENETPIEEEEGGSFFDKLGEEKKLPGIMIAGDGIGTRKATGRNWGVYGNFDDEE